MAGEIKCLVLIPARFGSTRFPGKPLKEVGGKKLIDWVYDHCLEASQASENTSLKFHHVVVTDHPEIEDWLKSHNRHVVRVDDEVTTGSERIYLAWKKYFGADNYDFVVNVQGDEPLIRGEDLVELINFHHQSTFDISTYVKESSSLEEFENSNIVKVIYHRDNGHCSYFSRSPIPFHRNRDFEKFYKHIGIYCYRAQALEKFFNAPVGQYETRESLEQLRALEINLKIGALTTKRQFIGVDCPEDLKKLEGVLCE